MDIRGDFITDEEHDALYTVFGNLPSHVVRAPDITPQSQDGRLYTLVLIIGALLGVAVLVAV